MDPVPRLYHLCAEGLLVGYSNSNNHGYPTVEIGAACRKSANGIRTSGVVLGISLFHLKSPLLLTRQLLSIPDDVNMKLSFSLSCASFLLSAHALASDASIYLSDASDTPAPQVLSPHATRLLLARRLGVSNYHSLEGADEPTLKTLNEFGGQQKSILSPDERWQDPQRNLIIIEDIENPRGNNLSTLSILISSNIPAI